MAAWSPIDSPSAYCLSISFNAASDFPSSRYVSVVTNMACRRSASSRALLVIRLHLLAGFRVPAAVHEVCGDADTGIGEGRCRSARAFRYCAIDSSNLPIFIRSSAYESYGFGSSGISAMYFLYAASAPA